MLMKRILVFFVAFITLSVCFAQAQVKPNYLKMNKGQFFNENGAVISSSQLQAIIGDDIYNETYVGAIKQYKTGKNLVLWGAIGAGVGLVALGGFSAAMASKYGNKLPQEAQKDPLLLGLAGGYVLTAAGTTALAVGIPLTTIGKKRLNWIADDYNEKQSKISLNMIGCPAGYGVGLALNF